MLEGIISRSDEEGNNYRVLQITNKSLINPIYYEPYRLEKFAEHLEKEHQLHFSDIRVFHYQIHDLFSFVGYFFERKCTEDNIGPIAKIVYMRALPTVTNYDNYLYLMDDLRQMPSKESLEIFFNNGNKLVFYYDKTKGIIIFLNNPSGEMTKEVFNIDDIEKAYTMFETLLGKCKVDNL